MAAPTSTNEVTARKFSSSISALWTKIKSTFQTLGNLVTAWGSTPSDTKYPSEKLVKDSLDAISTNARTIPQDVSKGANLVVNGSGRMASNYNFTSFLYVPTISYGGSAGSFGYNGTGAENEYISCDFNKKVVFSADVKNLVAQPSNCIHRLYVLEFDIDKKSINAIHVMYGVGTLTELTQDLNPGDTVVHLADLSNANWLSATTYHRGFIFWNYQNSYGYLYPPETYSRNVYPSADSNPLWDVANVNVSAGTITLNSGWTGPAIPAGTKVSRRSRGNTYPYPASVTTGDTEWHSMKGYMRGVTSPGTSERSSTKFSQGTAFIRAGIYPSNLNNADPVVNKRAVVANFAIYEEQDINDGFGTLPVNRGGTGATTAIGAEYNILNQVADIDTTINGNRKIALCNQTKSASNGVFRWLKLINVWTWIKGLLSSESGVNISGNAATATALSAGADRTKLDGIAAGAEVNVQSDWNQATTTADDYIKNKPTIPSGTQLVYDCGTGSTSTTDFDNALAAFNAGNWVIIHSSGNTYHCVGTYNSGLRFKQIANETASIKVNTLNWTRGSAPSVGTQLEPSMPGHTHSQYVEKSGDTMSGNLTISKGANQGDTKFVTSRTDTGTTGWFGVGDGGQNHGVYSAKAYANTNNDVDNDTKGWVVRTDENGYSSLTGAVDGFFAKNFGATETLRGMKRFKFGYSLDREADYTHVSATAIIEARLYSAGVSGGTITMLFNASARGDVGSYYRLQVLSYNNWNLNNVCPVLITQNVSATAKSMFLALVSGGPTSTTLRTFSYSEVKVLPLNGTNKFNWSFGWDTTDFNSNTMTMIKPYVYPRAQIGTAIGDAGTPVYVKADGDFGTASGTDVAIALKDAGRADAPVTQDWRVKVGWGGSGVDACAPNGTSTYSAGQTVGTTKHLVTAYEYDGVGYYKDVQAGAVTVGNSEKWNGFSLAVQNPSSSPAANTLYIF